MPGTTTHLSSANPPSRQRISGDNARHSLLGTQQNPPAHAPTSSNVFCDLQERMRSHSGTERARLLNAARSPLARRSQCMPIGCDIGLRYDAPTTLAQAVPIARQTFTPPLGVELPDRYRCIGERRYPPPLASGNDPATGRDRHPGCQAAYQRKRRAGFRRPCPPDCPPLPKVVRPQYTSCVKRQRPGKPRRRR